MTTPADEAYLEGFMSGLEFALLAMEGRGLPGDAVSAFRADYARIVELYRAKHGPASVPVKAKAALLRN